MLLFSFFLCLFLLNFCFSQLNVSTQLQADCTEKEKHVSSPSVLVLDFGSQYTQLITKRIREQGIFSYILPYNTSLEKIIQLSPQVVILSGGPSSVYEEPSPKLDSKVIQYFLSNSLPILGICYGMQYLIQELGGKISKAQTHEYGKTLSKTLKDSYLFSFLNESKSFNTWMSHGDEVFELPMGFSCSAKSENGTIVAAENKKSHIYLVQFHPEVTHTEYGEQLINHFLKGIAKIPSTWTMESYAQKIVSSISQKIKDKEHVICALSGGVDSCVAAKLAHNALGNRLHCVFVDNGLLRNNEMEEVKNLFSKHLHLPVTYINASQQFYSNLKNITDPEKKRKIIGKTFIQIFENFADELGKKLKCPISHLIQGTIYPDVIESSPLTTHKYSQTIKSHHNVGGLPKNMHFSLIEPLKDLFKDEVRKLGQSLAIPNDFLKRHPFPGPGLAVRIIGEVTPEKIQILQHADKIFIQALKEDSIYDEIWQAGAIFLPIRTVGVQGDKRTHNYVLALRAVTSVDGMTAHWYAFDNLFLEKVSNRILNNIPNISRIVYDISSKPPATIEWE